MRPRIYKHTTAGWQLAMPGHDPVDVASHDEALALLRQLDDRPAATLTRRGRPRRRRRLVAG